MDRTGGHSKEGSRRSLEPMKIETRGKKDQEKVRAGESNLYSSRHGRTSNPNGPTEIMGIVVHEHLEGHQLPTSAGGATSEQKATGKENTWNRNAGGG